MPYDERASAFEDRSRELWLRKGPSAPPSAADLDEAAQREKRALSFSEYGEASRVELERAFALTGREELRYPIALADEQVGAYAEALVNFRAYRAHMGDRIAPDRRTVVDKEVAVLATRLVTVAVDCQRPGVEISVDGQSPFTRVCPGRVQFVANPGRRRIAIRGPSCDASIVVTAAGSEKRALVIR